MPDPHSVPVPGQCTGRTTLHVPLLQCVALWHRGVSSTVSNCCSDHRLFIPCCGAHNVTSMHKCEAIHFQHIMRKWHDLFLVFELLRLTEAGWGQQHADTKAAPNTFSCCSIYYGFLQIRPRCLRKQTPEKEEPIERFYLFSVILQANEVLWHKQRQNPFLQGNI